MLTFDWSSRSLHSIERQLLNSLLRLSAEVVVLAVVAAVATKVPLLRVRLSTSNQCSSTRRSTFLSVLTSSNEGMDQLGGISKRDKRVRRDQCCFHWCLSERCSSVSNSTKDASDREWPSSCICSSLMIGNEMLTKKTTTRPEG